jgi:hypothetical protein
MRVHFEAHGVRSELELQPGTWTVGCGADDGVRFPGLPPALLKLELGEDRVWVRCSAARPVGRAVLPAGVRRWLLPGERVRLSRDAQLWLEPEPGAPGTLALMRALYEGSSACQTIPALRCIAGVDAGAVFPLAGHSLELGRRPGCAVLLHDGAVSRRQLELVLDGDQHRVRNLGGRNPVRCNGRRLRPGRTLADGDVLAVGRSLLHYCAGLTSDPAPVTASATTPPVRPGAASAGGAG